MKKLMAVVMSMAVLLIAMPVSVSATSDDTQVINKHGSGTYMGTYEDWNNSSWDSDDFTEVTGEDIDCSDDLIIKGGKVGTVTVSDESSLTIYDGTMSDVESDGNITMSGGTADSLTSNDDDISISGGTVRGDVDADGSVTLSGKLAVGGSVTCTDVTAYATGSTGSTSVSGEISFSGTMELQGTNYKFGTIDGQSSGTLEFKNYNGTLPTISKLNALSVCSGSIVTTSGSAEIGTLNLEDNAEFATTATLTADTINGPGALVINAGGLTVNSGVSDYPVLEFNGSVGDGTTAFQAKSGTVSIGNMIVFGYSLTKQDSNVGFDTFVLKSLTGDGVTLNSSSVSVSSGQYATVTATVTPSLSSLVNGAKLQWKLIDSSSKFSIASDSNDNSCKIYLSSSAGTSAYSARLAVYLVDSSGAFLTDYKSASCSISSSASTVSSSGTSLDTSAVSISVGHTYSVLAVTSSKTPPVQMSYNSAVAVVGKATAYNYNGKAGWLYPVKAIAKGGVTIDIGGQKMITTVTA
jgi:hypothetical protein